MFRSVEPGVFLVELAFPGQFLGVSEEFVSGPGTREEEGKVYSMFFGELLRDERTHRVSVKPRKLVRPLKPGDLVYGVVHHLYDSMAMVKFSSLPSGGEFPANGDTAFLRISELMFGYVDRMGDCVRVGDVLRARVAQISPLATYLTVKERDLGVVLASCTNCRRENALSGQSFACVNCGWRQERKAPQQSKNGGE